MTVHTPADQQNPANPRRVGWFTGACVLVSNIIGGGIFTTTGFMARDVGDPLVILGLWLVGACIALVGAMCYSELGAALPHAGGDYIYLREAYGPLIAFLSGWTSFTIGFGAAIAASSVGFASYALRVVPSEGEHALLTKGLALLLLWSLTAVHVAGVDAGGRLQRVLTTTKVLAILLLIAGGLVSGTGNWNHLTMTNPEVPLSPGPLVIALIFVLYSYLGWNVAGYIAGEIKQPASTLPVIMVGGTAFVALLYLLINGIYFYALPVTTLGEAPVLPVAEKSAAALWGPTSASFVALLLALSIAGAVSAMVWAGPRVYWAMARDGVFSTWFAASDPVTGAPVRAILLQSMWASVLIATGTFEQLVIYSGLVLAGFIALTVGALIVLRIRQPNLPRPYRVPWYPVLPGLFIFCTLAIVANSVIARPVESMLGVVTVLAGIPLFLFWRSRSSLS